MYFSLKYIPQMWRINIFRQCAQSKSNLFHIKTQFKETEGALSRQNLVFYLSGVKVKVRIARRVKVKYVIKAILPVPTELRQVGEGPSHHRKNHSATSTSQEIPFPRDGSLSIVSILRKIPGGLGDIVPVLLHNSNTQHQLDTLDVNRDKSVSKWVEGEPLQLSVNFAGGWT